MKQQKMGEFLKDLRKEKGLTQEQLAEHFYVSSRTVSRWETGKNMPDVDMLIALADFYQVDVREIIDGERKNDDAENAKNESLKKVADYASEQTRRTRVKFLLMYIVLAWALVVSKVSYVFVYGFEHISKSDVLWTINFWFLSLFIDCLSCLGVFDKFNERWKNRKKNSHKKE